MFPRMKPLRDPRVQHANRRMSVAIFVFALLLALGVFWFKATIGYNH